jgi:ABC-type transporter Mla subunit MlaD
VERVNVINQLRATHGKTLDDLAEARSNIGQLTSQLQASQAAQERTASQLDKVKSRSEIAATSQAKTLSELNTVRASLAEAERNFVASQNAQDNTASELMEVRSELSAAHKRCEETESQLRESRSALESMKLELAKARAASPSPSPSESPGSNATPKPSGINGIREGGEGAKRPPRPRRNYFPDLMDPSRQQPVTFPTPPVHPDSKLRSTAPVHLYLAKKAQGGLPTGKVR